MPGNAAPPRARTQRTLRRSTARFRAARRALSANPGQRNCGPPRPIRRSSACPTLSVRCWSTARSPLRLSRDRRGPTFARAAARVTWSPMVDGDFPNRYGARLTVTTRSNERLSAEVADVRGTPERPFAQGELPAKFYDCARRVLQGDAPERLAAAVDRVGPCTGSHGAHRLRFGACVSPIGRHASPRRLAGSIKQGTRSRWRRYSSAGP